VKGVTLNYANSKVVKVTTLRDMILENAPPVLVHNPRKIKRKHGGVVVSQPETKRVCVFCENKKMMSLAAQ